MENKTPNYKMIPGSREKDTPGNFRDTPVNKYMETPTNDGHSPMELHESGHKEFGKVDSQKREEQSIGSAGTGMQRKAGQRKGKIGGITVKANVGKQRGATDLLQVGKDTVKKIKDYFSS